MTLPRLLTCTLLLTACIPGSKSLGEGETDDVDPTGASDDGEGGGTQGATSQGDGATSVGPGTATSGTGGGVTSNADGPGDDGPSTGVTSASTGDEDTGPVAACEIFEVACELAEQSKTPPIDCGDITFDDDAATWVAASDCAREAAAASEAFKLIVDVQGIDSLPRRALVGMVGFQYAMAELFQDIGGLAPDPSPVTTRACEAISPIPGCEPTVGEICLVCVGEGAPEPFCAG